MENTQNLLSQLLFNKVSDAIDTGLIGLTPNCTVFIWNQWMEIKSGIKKEDALGENLYSVFSCLTNILFKDAVADALRNSSASILAQSIHKSPLPLYLKPDSENSERINQAIDILPMDLGSDNGNYCLIKVSCVDSAVRREEERRQQTNELSKAVSNYQDSDALAKALAEISDEGVITFDMTGLVETFNPRAESLFGYSAKEVIGIGTEKFLSPVYAIQWRKFVKRFVRHRNLMGAGKWQFLEAQHKDGTFFPVYIKLSILDLADRTLLVGIVRDLTEIEASKQALYDSKTALELAMESGYLAMWDWDVVSNEINNESLLELLGYDPATCQLPWEKLVHPDDFDRVNTCVESYVAGVSDKLDIEYRVRAASNEWLWIHDAGKVVEREQKDRSQRIIGVNQIIHQRKIAEIEAKEVSEKLVEAARVKSDFLSNMSHELRTPMNGIMGILNLLESSMNSEEEQIYINVGKNSANSLLKLIDDVLDLSKLGAKSVQLEVLEFPPEEVLKDVVKLLSETAVKKSLNINYLLDNSLLTDHAFIIGTDPLRLRQVLTNLVGNAIKFTEQGQVQIRVNRLENDYILFEVEDTGIGIPQDRQKLIFEAFAQADLSTTRKYGGTGLGLGISRELVELMGGTISVVSAPCEGSIFSFTVMDHSKQSLRSQQNELESV